MNKNIQMKQRNGSNWDKLYPLTLLDNVYDSDGVTPLRNVIKKSDTIHVKDYGAVGDGIADDTNAIMSAVNQLVAQGKGTLMFSGGKTYKLSKSITLLANHCTITADGAYATLMNTSQDKDTIAIPGGLSYINICNLKLDRSVIPTTGNGINFLGTVTHSLISRVISTRNKIGIRLMSTDYSVVSNVMCLNNLSHGFYMVNSIDTLSVQWNFVSGCLSASNGGTGLVIVSQAGQPQVTLGTITHFDTYDNGGYGIAVLGNATTPIYGFRMANCFIGADKLDGLFLDSYGDMHTIQNSFFEISVGGNGMFITPNNKFIQIVNCFTQGNKKCGIFSQAKYTVVTGCTAINNGIGATIATDKIGISLNGDYSNIVGGISGNKDLSSFQEKGFSLLGNKSTARNIMLVNNSTVPPYTIMPSCKVENIGGDYIIAEKGVFTGTPNAQGILTFPHGLSVAPNKIILTSYSGQFCNVQVASITATHLSVILYGASGALITSGSHSIYWHTEV